jgi:hypothetical protein
MEKMWKTTPNVVLDLHFDDFLEPNKAKAPTGSRQAIVQAGAAASAELSS